MKFNAMQWGIYVINLDRSTERLQAIATQLSRLGLCYERIRGVDGRLASLDEQAQLDEAKYRRLHGKTPIPGELGCYLSHVRALETFRASRFKYALVLEDDAILEDNLPVILEALANCHNAWDTVKLSGVHSGTPVALQNICGGSQLCVMLTKCTAASAYAVNRKAAESYLEKLLPMSLPYDHEFDQGWKYGLAVRAVLPFPVTHNEVVTSDIGDVPNTRKLPRRQRLGTHWHRLRTELHRLGYGIKTLLNQKFTQ